MDKILAIIPARSGSKRIKNKNMRVVGGKTLVEWAVIAAKESCLVDEIIVTSDSSLIRKHAEELGVKTLDRSELASSDQAYALMMLNDVYARLSPQKWDGIVLLEPSAPIRAYGFVDHCINIWKENKESMVLSIEKNQIVWYAGIIKDGAFLPLMPEKYNKRTQELEPVFLLTSDVFVLPWDLAGIHYDGRHITQLVPQIIGVPIPDNIISCNIDYEKNLLLADLLISSQRGLLVGNKKV